MLDRTTNGFRFVAGYKKTLSYLWDEVPGTIFYLQQLHIYKREYDILNWLVKNEIKGQKLVEFFQNESDRKRGTLIAITKVINKLEGRSYGSVRSLKPYDLKEK